MSTGDIYTLYFHAVCALLQSHDIKKDKYKAWKQKINTSTQSTTIFAFYSQLYVITSWCHMTLVHILYDLIAYITSKYPPMVRPLQAANSREACMVASVSSWLPCWLCLLSPRWTQTHCSSKTKLSCGLYYALWPLGVLLIKTDDGNWYPVSTHQQSSFLLCHQIIAFSLPWPTFCATRIWDEKQS